MEVDAVDRNRPNWNEFIKLLADLSLNPSLS